MDEDQLIKGIMNNIDRRKWQFIRCHKIPVSVKKNDGMDNYTHTAQHQINQLNLGNKFHYIYQCKKV